MPYIGYLVTGEMPFIQDPRGMAGVGLIGLVVAYAVWGLRLETLFGRVRAVAGARAVGLGLAALLVGLEGSDLLLAFFIGAIVVIWLAETMFDVGSFRHEPAPPRVLTRT